MSLHISRRETKKNNESKKPEYSLGLSIVFILISSVGLVFGAEWLIKGATGIAVGLGISDLVISVSLVAFGTSVPELATSIIAALKKETDISIGNIIGSNIFNVFGILGITSVIKNIQIINDSLYLNLYWMLGASFLLLFFLIPFGKKISSRFMEIVYFVIYYSTAKSGIIKKWEGAIFVGFYVFYIVWLVNGSF
jgi:cation:H+ antiporter